MEPVVENNQHKNQRIARNTVMLYIRTIFTMLVSLYTSRVILKVLGIDDFGIYNVVGGAISMFSIFSGSLSGAISRFITFGLGQGNLQRLKIIFSTSVSIQIGLSLLLFVLAEIGGLWMLNTNLNIPEERMYAAHWVLQFSILTFVMGLINVPYNACIIAHEHMKIFAYMSILEVSLKLLFVVLLSFAPFDKLIVYALLLFLITLLLRVIYGIYCTRHFEECRYHWVLDKPLLKEMANYAFWGFFGNAAYTFNTQGVNILINVFFGVTLNAARGIVTQVEGAVMQFVNNFMTAVSPQITKSYAAGDKEYMFALICRGAKFSYILLLFFLIPLGVEAHTVLRLWLGTVPDYAPLFLQMTLCSSAIVLLGNTSFTAVMATGKIRNYQLVVTIVGCLVFPFTWIAYRCGFPAVTTYVIYMVIYAILDVIRLFFLRRLLGFEVSMFFNKVVRPVVFVTVTALIFPLSIHVAMAPSVLRLILVILTSTIMVTLCALRWGLDGGERKTVLAKVKNKISRK